ncbi:MAG: DUF523 domain-containing protein [bacterium]
MTRATPGGETTAWLRTCGSCRSAPRWRPAWASRARRCGWYARRRPRADGGAPERTDWTQALADVAAARIPALRAAGIRGFIFKSQSPSCGMERVKTYRENGYGHKDCAGLFAAALMRRPGPSCP